MVRELTTGNEEGTIHDLPMSGRRHLATGLHVRIDYRDILGGLRKQSELIRTSGAAHPL